MQSHKGLFDKPKYTRHSRVGTWTPNQITVRIFKGRVGVDSVVGEDKGDIQKGYQGKEDCQDIGGLVIIKPRPFFSLMRH